MEPDDSHVREVQRLFLQQANRLRGFILGLLPDRTLAEDVLQEVFLIVTAKAAEFQSGTDFLAWVRAIARLKVREHRRRRFPAAGQLTDEAWDMLAESAHEMDDVRETKVEKQRCQEPRETKVSGTNGTVVCLTGVTP